MNAQALDSAFRATSYRVETNEGVFVLRIGLADPAFDDFLRRRGVSCWGLITAYNPRARRCDDATNARRQALLRERLQTLERTVLPACNQPDDGAAPVEASFLLMPASQAELRALASEFFQRAFVYGTIGTAPRLVYVPTMA